MCAIILLGDYDCIELDTEIVVTRLFISVVGLAREYLEDARAFFINLLPKQARLTSVQFIAYSILGCHLLLKDEDAVSETFNFLNKTAILQNTNFEYHASHSAQAINVATLLLVKNSDFIKNNALKKDLINLFTSMTRICKERYDIKAISALFERTFTKQQQEKYVQLLPEIGAIRYSDRPAFLTKRGLSATQVQILTKSIFNAERFIDGSDYEVELNQNIFFETWTKLYKENDP